MRGQNQALGTPKGDTEGVEKGLKKAQKQQGRQRAPKCVFASSDMAKLVLGRRSNWTLGALEGDMVELQRA